MPQCFAPVLHPIRSHFSDVLKSQTSGAKIEGSVVLYLCVYSFQSFLRKCCYISVAWDLDGTCCRGLN